MNRQMSWDSQFYARTMGSLLVMCMLATLFSFEMWVA